MLDGGRYALLHTRTLELDELRPYTPGDDVRDIDWKASARSSDVLVKRFVSEQHHKIVLVADAGRNVAALAPGGEIKRDVAVTAMGAVGLIALARSDEVGLIYGDGRGAVSIRSRRGEAHIESLLERFYTHGTDSPSDIGTQLDHVARAHRSRLLVIVVSDEPDVTPALEQTLQRLSGRHEVLWLLTPDMPAVGGDDDRDGFDLATGRFVLGAATLGSRVVEAYRAAEERRAANLNSFLTANRIPFARVGASSEIRSALTQLSQVYRHAG
jgi:uncharacterized protein (DUF58 family)